MMPKNPVELERILMTFDAVGGVYGYTLSLAKRLSSEGVELLLIAMGETLTAQQRRELSRLPHVTLMESRFALEWMHDPWADVERAGECLLRLAREFEPSLVHLNGYSHASLGFQVPVLVVAHSCVASWWRAVLQEPAPAKYDEYRMRVQAGLRAASAVVAPSGAMLQALGREHGVPLEHAAIVHNGACEERFKPGTKEHFVLASGRLWDRAKNLAAVAARADELLWPLQLAGGTTSPDGAQLSLPPSVFAAGTLSRFAMAGVMARASIFVHPALYEPFGLAPLEAGLAGCALVLSDIDSLREIWGDAATFVPPRDVGALIEATNRLAANPALRETAARKARERAVRYSERAFTDAYMELYGALVHRPGGAPAAPRSAADLCA